MNYVLFHKDCADGFAAAWAAWKKLGDTNTKYLPVQYQQPLPDLPDAQELYIVDFSYPRDTLLEVQKRVHKLVVLDHHKTAEQELRGLDFVTFNMERSGCVLTWEYFYPDTPVPTLLQYVADRDLWRFVLPNSKEVNAALATFKKDFKVFDNLVNLGNTTIGNLTRIGDVLVKQTDTVVSSLCDKCFYDETKFGVKVPMLNSSTLQSEIGNELCKRHPEMPFAAIFFYLDLNTRVWSLRSIGDNDVSTVAKRFNGGGHQRAASFKETV